MAPQSNGKVRQVLRDPETLDFLRGQLDKLVEYKKAEVEENPDKRVEYRTDIRRIRLVQKNMEHNASATRRRAGEEFEDEI